MIKKANSFFLLSCYFKLSPVYSNELIMLNITILQDNSICYGSRGWRTWTHLHPLLASYLDMSPKPGPKLPHMQSSTGGRSNGILLSTEYLRQCTELSLLLALIKYWQTWQLHLNLWHPSLMGYSSLFTSQL